jgi:uncharacterized protein YkwD
MFQANSTRTKRIGRLIAAVLIAGSLSGFNSGVARADTVSDEDQFVTLINQERVAAGLPPYKVNQALIDAARNWAGKMREASVAIGTTNCLISHNPNLRTAVNATWKKLGENVGCGDVNVAELHDAFMRSPKHKDNIMHADFDSIGIGIVMEGDTIFVTEQFMQEDKTPKPAPTIAPPPSALALRPPNVKGVVEVASPPAPAQPKKSTRPVKAAKKKKPAKPAAPLS